MWGGVAVMDSERTHALARKRRDLVIADRWVTNAPRAIRRTHLRVVNEPDPTRDWVVPDRREGRTPSAGVSSRARWFGAVGWGAGTVILAADLLSRWL